MQPQRCKGRPGQQGRQTRAIPASREGAGRCGVPPKAPPWRPRLAAVTLACVGVLAGALPGRAQAAEPPFDLGDGTRIEAGRLRYAQTSTLR